MKNKGIKSIYILILILTVFLTGCTQASGANTNKSASIKSTDVFQKLQEDIEPEPQIKTAKITAVGDLMVHSWQYIEAYDKETVTYDFMHNFELVKKYFDDSDVVIGNLETVFAGMDRGVSDYPCFNTPDEFAESLKYAGFDILSTANNHCMDKGQDGLLRTLQVLDEKGIDHVGTYATQEDRDTIFIKNINGIDIAFLSYTYGTNGIPVIDDYNVNIIDEDIMVKDIQHARELADFVVVMPHMGNEYELFVKDVFKNWADTMFNAGADVILASHPHVLQPMEYKTITNEDGSQREGFVIYSLGNFISSQTTVPRNAGVILNIDIEQTDDQQPIIKKVSVIPTWTRFRNINNQDDFTVYSVYDLLSLSEEELKNTIRQKDINRIKDIQVESTTMLLGTTINEPQEEYTFERVQENNKN